MTAAQLAASVSGPSTGQADRQAHSTPGCSLLQAQAQGADGSTLPLVIPFPLPLPESSIHLEPTPSHRPLLLPPNPTALGACGRWPVASGHPRVVSPRAGAIPPNIRHAAPCSHAPSAHSQKTQNAHRSSASGQAAILVDRGPWLRGRGPPAARPRCKALLLFAVWWKHWTTLQRNQQWQHG